jgi:hypothetical protein
MLEEAVKRVHADADRLENTGQYDRCLVARLKGGQLRNNVDKVAVAREVAKQPADLDVLDLRERIGKLVEFIRKSNGLG